MFTCHGTGMNAKRSEPKPKHRRSAGQRALSIFMPGISIATRWRGAFMVLVSGLLMGWSIPSHNVPLVWLINMVPFFLGLDWIMAAPSGSSVRRALKVAAACWGGGVMSAWVIGDWITNTAHVYGGLSAPMAWAVGVFGYGSLIGFEFIVFLGLPCFLCRHRPRLALILLPVWIAATQAYLPRILYWTFGQFMWPWSWLIQGADILGSAGLNLIFIPLQLVLYGWVKTMLGDAPASRKEMAAASAAVALLLAAAALYGHLRLIELADAATRGIPLRVVAVQPNFSLARLASNPELSHSDREQSIAALMDDTERALRAFDDVGAGPTLVIWPESVFPLRFLEHDRAQELLGRWAQARNVHLVLTTVEVETGHAGTARDPVRHYGVAVHVDPSGGPLEVYRKMFLIPFGETIPLGGIFPAYRRLLKSWIPQISEFDAGTEYTVFEIGDGVRLAPMICYDVVQVSIAQGMVGNGANFAIVLANLAWFGRSSGSEQFEFGTRFRALENRVPIFLVSQNGRTVLIDARGQPASRRTELFQADALSLSLRLPDRGSFYSRHARQVHATYAVLAVLLTALLLWGRWKQWK